MSSNKKIYEIVLPLMKRIFPKIFLHKGFVPLEVGIHKKIVDRIASSSESVTKTMVRKAIRFHCGLKGYLISVLKSQYRYHSDGSVGSVISDKEKMIAKEKLEKHKKLKLQSRAKRKFSRNENTKSSMKKMPTKVVIKNRRRLSLTKPRNENTGACAV